MSHTSLPLGLSHTETGEARAAVIILSCNDGALWNLHNNGNCVKRPNWLKELPVPIKCGRFLPVILSPLKWWGVTCLPLWLSDTVVPGLLYNLYLTQSTWDDLHCSGVTPFLILHVRDQWIYLQGTRIAKKNNKRQHTVCRLCSLQLHNLPWGHLKSTVITV